MSIQSISRCLRRSAVLLPLAAIVACQSPEEALLPDDHPATTAALVQPAPGTTALPAARDTSIRLSALNTNFGRDATLDVNRTLVAFDQAAVQAALGPQDYLVSAQLELTLTSNNLRPRQPTRTVAAHRLTRAWTETGATWSCAVDSKPTNNKADCSGATAWSMGVLPPNPFVVPATAQATVAPTQTGPIRFDVTADVRGFLSGSLPNHGWMLRSGLLGVFAEFAEFAARESSTPPRLLLTIRRCSPAICDDGIACTADSCGAEGLCVSAPVSNGTACSDGNACTQLDTCQAGACVGASPVVCTALDQCHVAGVCDTATGQCSNPSAPEGQSCNDGNMCTAGDRCVAGACAPGATDTCAPPPVAINEIESNTSPATPDWIELFNRGTTPVDLSGYVFKDNDDTHAYTIPAGTVLAPGAYLVIEESATGFGLGGADSTRLFMPSPSTTVVDTHSWTAHAATTYGRCPNGTGAFTTMTTVTKGAVNDCSVAVVVNEVESNTSPASPDWIELYNKGPLAADLSGYVLKDNDDTHAYTIPAGTVVAPGAYLVVEETALGFGLGSGDSARLFPPSPTPTTPTIDSYTWTAHAPVTWGRCPNGTGAFINNTTSTKGVTNDCGPPPPPPADVVINEIESNTSPATPDWVELYNRGTTAADLSGYVFRDSGTTGYTLPPGTVIPVGGFLVLEETAFGFGLGGGDAANLFAANGTTVVDSYVWTAHALTTYSRCPNSGSGSPFITSTAITKGTANQCPSFVAWPGGSTVSTIDPVDSFTSNLSGLTYEPATPLGPGALWAVTNSPSKLYRLVPDGTGQYIKSPDDGWADGKTMVYPDGSGVPDSEGVTRGVPTSSSMYVATERDNVMGTVSRLVILRYDTSTPGTLLTGLQQWDITSQLPVVGPNLGLEAITFVSDADLAAIQFRDDSGNLYTPPTNDHGGGVFFVGVEGTGLIYAFSLDHVTNTATRLATILTGQSGVMGLEFDRDTGDLWSWCDDTCGNKAIVLGTTSSSMGRFVIRAAYDKPMGLAANFNNEGIAFTECSGNVRTFFWCDDTNNEHHALRAGTLSCTSPP